MIRMGTLIGLILSVTLGLYADGAGKSNIGPVPARSSAAEAAAAVREYRLAHEHAIMAEFREFLAIPNIASDTPNITHNAQHLAEMMEAAGVKPQRLEIPGRGPVMYGEIVTPGAKRTVIFYAHYDGQPVDAAVWIGNKPFEPVLYNGSLTAGAKQIPFPEAPAHYENDWRIYARSASDDKAAEVGILTAIRALREKHIPMSVNVKLVFEGEEEAGSQHLESVVNSHRELMTGDLLLVCDGPADQSGRPQVTFGNRGVLGAELTVYGPVRALHSGHYGNWAPNPAMRLAQLLASMKDADGRVLVAGFYDDVAPFGPLERKAIEEAPANEELLERDLGIAHPDGAGKRLNELLALPTLNVRGIRSAYVGEQSQNVIPERAVASIDIRLVKNVEPETEFARLKAHIEKQGYSVFDREPTIEERRKYPRVARLDYEGGYRAVRTPMDLPVSVAVLATVAGATGEKTVALPLLGGSVPMYIFENLKLPVIGVPIANYDNSQHSTNENIRVGNFWRGIDTYGALMAGMEW